MFDKNIFFGVLAGIAIGVVGTKVYQANKAEIDEKLKSLRDLNPLANNAAKEAEGDEACITREELEAQKEHLEDLIAELDAKEQQLQTNN